MNLAAWYMAAALVNAVLAVASAGAATHYFIVLTCLCLLASAGAHHRGL